MIIQHQPGSGGHTRVTPKGNTFTYRYGGGGGTGAEFLAGAGQFAGALADVYKGMSSGLSGLGIGQAAAGVGGGLGSGMAGIAGGFGNLGAGMAGAAAQHSGALSGLGNAMASNYGAYAGSLAGMANAQANERAAAYAAMAQSEAARQMAAGNIANQALAGYGSLGNAAMAAWGQNQAAYNQALSNMFTSNQGAASQLGQSRNQALEGLGDSTAQLGRGLAVAEVVGNVDFGMGGPGGGGFLATSPTGSVASGSYGLGDGGMIGSASRGVGPEFSGAADRSFGGLGNLRGDLNTTTYLDNLEAARSDGLGRLDAQHYSSRDVPLTAFRDSFDNFRQLAGDGYGQLSGGMSQFYGNVNANRANFSPMLSGATQGYYNSTNDIRGLGGRMTDDLRYGIGQAGSVIPGMSELGGNLASGVGGIMSGIGGVMGNALSALTSGMENTQNSVGSMWGDVLGEARGNREGSRERLRKRIESLGGTYFG